MLWLTAGTLCTADLVQGGHWCRCGFPILSKRKQGKGWQEQRKGAAAAKRSTTPFSKRREQYANQLCGSRAVAWIWCWARCRSSGVNCAAEYKGQQSELSLLHRINKRSVPFVTQGAWPAGDLNEIVVCGGVCADLCGGSCETQLVGQLSPCCCCLGWCGLAHYCHFCRLLTTWV